MSQPDGEPKAKEPQAEPDGATATLDRDSEGVYYISVEDFERRIVPKDPPAPGASPRAGKGDGG